MKKIAFLSGLFLFVNCKSVFTDFKTSEAIQLGTIIKQDGFNSQRNIQHVAKPVFKQPIPLYVKRTAFTKTSYKSFLRAKETQNSHLNISFDDSISTRPYYVRIGILGRVDVLSALANKLNTPVLDFLKTSRKNAIITEVSMAVSPDILEILTKSDQIFLRSEHSNNLYAFMRYGEDGDLHKINVKSSVVFGYKRAGFCWEETNRQPLKIVDWNYGNKNCPSGSTKDPKKALKKNELIK